MAENFGGLTTRNNLYNKKEPLSYLFDETNKSLEKFEVIQKEREIAFENLKKLTTELQTKRLRYNAKAACKYFTL